MSVYIINIGSNVGDRRLNLSRAMSAINREFGSFEMSHALVSDPWGFESQGKFLNVCILFNSDEQPEEVLERLQAIEKKISPEPHRTPTGEYKDRVIDIDIVAIDDKVIETEKLKVPHPHLAQRRFFLEPLEEVAPGWRHPLTGKTASEMLAELPSEDE
ncbi:MAG: 2-amino-4-hydroxy-6-hydroxymethyldihydropteridine diphosphokinase [Bacteroidales bacterium]|nr:2-amino-4-hydroxy-6-hydroxymethyldihydropteridine diphosphokinase [Bacteroidales bacterium]